MYNKEELMRQLRELGLKKGDTVELHISLRSMGPVEGGADTVLDAILGVIGEEGLLSTPTHTWHLIPRKSRLYDVRNTPSCTGTLGEVARRRPDGIRSLHPSHSVVAFGRDKEAFVAGEELITSPADPKGIGGKLLDRDVKVLLVGVGQEKNTLLHTVEELDDMPGRLSPRDREVTIIDWEGREHKSVIQNHCRPISVYFPKFEPAFRAYGALKDGKWGDAAVQLCSGRRLRDVMRAITGSTDEELVNDCEPLREELWKDLSFPWMNEN